MDDVDSFERELHKAVNSKSIETLLSLCDDPTKKRVVLDFKGYYDKKSLVHYAAEFGSVDLLKRLVCLGANVKETAGSGKNTLHFACEKGNEKIVDYLMQTVSDSSFKSAFTMDFDKKVYKNSFYYAAISSNSNIVYCLKNKGNLDIDEALPNKSTALFTLVKQNLYEAAKLLCQCGADVNLGFHGRHLRPIHYTAERETHTKMLKLLLEYGANVNEHWGDPPYGHQPLFFALKHKLKENAKLLLEKGADISFKGRVTKIGWIDCFCLAAMNCPSLIPDFLNRGANPDTENDGSSVLIIAFENYANRNDLLALIKAGARQGRDGKTAIQCCKSYNQLYLFIQAGISVDEIESRHGVSTLDKLLRTKFPCSQKLKIQNEVSKLLSDGANPNLTQEGEDSPLILAIKLNLFEIADKLIEAGANVNHIGENETNPANACCVSGLSANKNATMEAMIKKGLLLNNQHPCGNHLIDLIVDADFDSSVLMLMIEKGADLNLVKDENDSILMKVVKQKRYQVCCALIEGGADVSYRNAKGLTAFDIYGDLFLDSKTEIYKHKDSDINLDKMKVFKSFLAAGIDVNKCTVSEIYPLIIAVWLRSEDSVKLILKMGGDVNIMDNYYDTPLTTALEFDLGEIVNDLLKAKANVNHKGGEKLVQWMVENEEPSNAKYMKLSNLCGSCIPQNSYLIKYGHTVLTRIITDMPLLSVERKDVYIRLLLEFGADPNLEETKRYSTLMHAILFESHVLVRTLIEAGANVNYMGEGNMTALHIYFQQRHIKGTFVVGCKTHKKRIDAGKHLILQMLLDKKACTNAKSLHGDLPIHLALRMKYDDIEIHIKDVLLLLNHSTEINTPDSNNITPVILAAQSCTIDVIRKMTEIGADVKCKDNQGNTALHTHMDSERFDRETVLILLRCGASLNIHNDLGETPLIRFIKRRHCALEDIQFLLKNGADLDSSSEGCSSALIVAIKHNKFTLLHYFIRAKVNLNHVGEGGKTALHVALLKGKCRFDVSIEAKIKQMTSNTTQSSVQADPLVSYGKRYWCSENEKSLVKIRTTGSCNWSEQVVTVPPETPKSKKNKYMDKVVETITLLLNADADVNIITEKGKSPLYLLLSRHQSDIVQTLLPVILDKGADPNLGHYPPLEIATLLQQQAVVKSLLNCGAKVDIKNKRCQTPLIGASRMCFLEDKDKLREIMETLLNEGASINVKDENGNPPLIISIINGCFQRKDNCDSEMNKIVSLLLKKGADPNIADIGKDSALILAVENMLPSVVETLLVFGANVDHVGELCMSMLQRCVQTKNNTSSNFEMMNVLLSNRSFGEEINVFVPQFWEYMQKPYDLKASSSFLEQEINKRLIGKVSSIVLSKSHAIPNFTSELHNSALIYFCQIECLDAVKLLIQYDADVNAIDEEGKTAIHHVIKINDSCTAEPMLDCILRRQPNLHLTDRAGKTALETAMCYIDAQFVQSNWYNERKTYLAEHERVKLITLRRLMIRLLESGATTEVYSLNSTLINFSHAGDFNGMKALISHGADMNYREKSGNSILHVCWSYCINESLAFLKWVHGKGFDLGIVNADEDSILMSMLASRNHGKKDEKFAEIVHFFAENDVKFVANKYKNSPLHNAAIGGYAKTIEALIEYGVDVCCRNESGLTPVHSCFENPDKTNGPQVISQLLTVALSKEDIKSLEGGKLLYLSSMIECNTDSKEESANLQTKLTEILLNYGADPNDHEGDDIPLIAACKQNNIALATLLLDSGANVNVTNSGGSSILHILFSFFSDKEKKLQLVRLLLERGIHVDMVDKSGRSALFLAIQTCSDDPIDDRDEMEIYSPAKKLDYNASREIVLELLQNGSDVNLQDNSGNTALTTFCHSGSDVFIGEALIQAGADPKSCDNIYCLHFAVTNRQLRSSTEPWVNFVCLLLDKGAYPNEFKGNVSNLIEVTVKKNILLIEKILKHGGDVNFADNTKRTALHYACIIKNAMDRDEIIDKLLDFGAGLNCPSITGEKPLDVLMKSMIHDLRNNCDIWDNPNDPCYQKYVVDLSSFNRFVSGGCDLTPVQDLKTDMFISFQKYIFEWSTNLIVESNDRSNESVLLTLLQTGLFETAECLIRCGWQVEREKWFSTNKIANLHASGIEICGTSRILEVQDGQDRFKKFIDKKDIGPISLSIICRKTIRQQLIKASRGAEIETRINLLPIPSIIQSFLAFRYLLQDYEIIKLRKNHSSLYSTRNRFEMPYYSENDNEYSHITDFDYDVY